MLDIVNLKEILVVSIALSTITCAIVQKTKKCFKRSSILMIYSLALNMFLGILFCESFTTVKFPNSLWVGLFSFLGADAIYKSLEGKLLSLRELKSNI